jgi:hypothetical protein
MQKTLIVAALTLVSVMLTGCNTPLDRSSGPRIGQGATYNPAMPQEPVMQRPQAQPYSPYERNNQP